MVEFGCDNSHSAHVVSRLMQSHIVTQSSAQQQFVTQTKPKQARKIEQELRSLL